MGSGVTKPQTENAQNGKNQKENSSSKNFESKSRNERTSPSRRNMIPKNVGKKNRNSEQPKHHLLGKIIDKLEESPVSPDMNLSRVENSKKNFARRRQRSFSLPPNKQKHILEVIMEKRKAKFLTGKKKKTKKVDFTTAIRVGRDVNGQKQINEYIIKKNLGAGAFGKVKLGYNRQTGVHYAIKSIDKSRMKKFMTKFPRPGRGRWGRRGRGRFGMRGRGRGRGRSKFLPPKYRKLYGGEEEEEEEQGISLKEVAILKKIEHPNIVKLFEVIDDPKKEKIYLIYEFVKGGTVMTINMNNETDKEPYSEQKARKLFIDLIKGLEFLHKNNIIHRDIKPENLLLTENGTLKITDFGVSKICEGDDLLKSSQGTYFFFPPEACSSGAYRGRPFDIWSCGISLYIMIFGRLPFFSKLNIMEIYNKIREANLIFPDDIEITESCRDFFRKILQKDPEKRITIEGIKKHEWITQNGKYQFVNEFEIQTNVTDKEIKNALIEGETTKMLERFLVMQKVAFKMKKKVEKIRKRIKYSKKVTNILDETENDITVLGDILTPMDEKEKLEDYLVGISFGTVPTSI